MPLRYRYAKLLTAAAVALFAAGTVPTQALQETPLNDIFETQTAQDALVAPIPHVTSMPRLGLVPRRPAKADFGVFNSVAISAGTLPTGKAWDKIHAEDYASLYTANCHFGDKVCNSPVATKFRSIAEQAAGMGQHARLEFISRSVNRAVAYRDDSVGWGRSDYWADPTEIASRGYGDCEDYATAKMWMLRALGYDADQLQLVVLKETRRNLFHAVLVVHVDGERYVLDNLTNNVATDGVFASYVPLVSFQGDNSYIHGFSGKSTAVAAISQ